MPPGDPRRGQARRRRRSSARAAGTGRELWASPTMSTCRASSPTRSRTWRGPRSSCCARVRGPAGRADPGPGLRLPGGQHRLPERAGRDPRWRPLRRPGAGRRRRRDGGGDPRTLDRADRGGCVRARARIFASSARSIATRPDVRSRLGCLRATGRAALAASGLRRDTRSCAGLPAFARSVRLSRRTACGGITQAMTATLAHRGPDDADLWIDADAGVALGHRRLSIIDLSAAGHQPMISACGRFVITYNGEIYNFRELRAELEQRGHALSRPLRHRGAARGARRVGRRAERSAA